MGTITRIRTIIGEALGMAYGGALIGLGAGALAKELPLNLLSSTPVRQWIITGVLYMCAKEIFKHGRSAPSRQDRPRVSLKDDHDPQ